MEFGDHYSRIGCVYFHAKANFQTKSQNEQKTRVSFRFRFELLPGKVDPDIRRPSADLGEGERCDITPDLHRLPKHTPHLLLVHLPGETYNPAGNQHRCQCQRINTTSTAAGRDHQRRYLLSLQRWRGTVTDLFPNCSDNNHPTRKTTQNGSIKPAQFFSFFS